MRRSAARHSGGRWKIETALVDRVPDRSGHGQRRARKHSILADEAVSFAADGATLKNEIAVVAADSGHRIGDEHQPVDAFRVDRHSKTRRMNMVPVNNDP